MSIKSQLDRQFPTLSRLYRILRDKIDLTRLRQPALIVNGLKIVGENQDSIDYRTISNEMAILRGGLQCCDVFIDVGANIGLFSCIAASRGIKTLAVEPSPVNLKYLFRNILENDVGSIEVFPIAISNQMGVMPLWGSGQGASLVKGWGGLTANYATNVPVNTLDNLVFDRFRAKRLFVKVDVEGAEADVIRGAINIIEHTIPPIFMIEIGFKENFPGGFNKRYRTIFKFFFDRGYFVFAIEAGCLVALEMIDEWEKKGAQEFYCLNFLFYKNMDASYWINEISGSKHPK